MENTWNQDHIDAVEETTEDINPMEDLGVVEDDNIHVVENEQSYEEEFEKLLKEEENVVIEDDPVLPKPGEITIVKSKQNTLKNSKLDFNRNTGGSRLSKLMEREDNMSL